ncbi:tetratricopeptide repeat protein [Thioalkalicoccus limnaeus]|uniref:Tetratricopeptide repeat protein n=1 Tax=Thioalkalicoccus limnaeus TaxID=120681 RepID=A0ABV4BGD8_9GAMM
MLRSLIVCVIVIGLAACAAPTRTGPPAPIVSAPTGPAPGAAVPPAPAAPPAQPVETFAYHPPSPTAEGPAPEAPTVPDRTSSDRAATEGPSLAMAAPQGSDLAAGTGLPAAADSLRRQAESQRQAGDYAGAAASLERALRIAPQSAYLWNRLARVRLEQGLVSQAGNLAARSNTLAGDQPQLQQDNWAMIGVARRTAGDAEGAAEAERRARGG